MKNNRFRINICKTCFLGNMNVFSKKGKCRLLVHSPKLCQPDLVPWCCLGTKQFGSTIMYFFLKKISFRRISQNFCLFLSCTTSRTKCPIMSAWDIVEDLDVLDDQQQEHASGGYGRLVEWSLIKSKNFLIIQTRKLWNLNLNRRNTTASLMECR